MSWFFFTIATVVFWGISQVLLKKGLTFLTPWHSYAFDSATAILLWLPYALLSGLNIPSFTFLSIALGLLMGIGVGIYYYVMEKGPLSIISPILGASPIITVMFSFAFLGETLSYVQLGAVLLTIFGVIIISIPKKGTKVRENLWLFLAIFLTIYWGIEAVITKYLVDTGNNSTFLLVLALGQISAVILWYMLKRPKAIIPKLPKKYLLPTILGAILFNSGTITYGLAMEKGIASIVGPVSNLSIIMTVVGSVLFLKEKIHRRQLFGITVAIAGVLLIHATVGNNSSIPSLNNADTIVPTPTPHTSLTRAKVTYVLDGDTIEVENGLRIRYIGVDTPERNGKDGKKEECFAQNAFEANKALVLNQTVELEKDVSEKDAYERQLRYVYVDGELLNDFLLRQGYGKLMTIPPDIKYATQLKEAEEEAKVHKRGLWGTCAVY